ncbi:hypothetical protein CEUSTIGMA_g4826.t1 [Chlamydomonas eustigma]|uniref:Urea active transporter n=1 Tax=Chlamydomonas eustigma TaxID=1157962 RepID=A0A250X3N2_9CHLO|nr:hypothetical protein CEUSTIGMA_g4826.t1 [Chlamydomonas eustigma]|eukprot:GAX77380.1 hypothetical protein CEUSTIGMA_g4826.t1 [Chlamydomonas eustigma]
MISSVEIKRKCPQIHTVLEVIMMRWGPTAHKVFLFFCLLTNVIVTSMLILGGASVISALSGVNIYAAAFLIPVGVMFYTAHGGLKATFMASWVHVTIIYIALIVYTFSIYAVNGDLGSPGKVWDNLTVMAGKVPVDGNRDGSYVTMLSQQGLIFGVINIIGNFGTVWVDQAYWQGAIAAQPSATFKGYVLGGLCWFSIPFTMATSMGLAARALDLPITSSEANQGLVPPAIAVFLLGQGGAFLMVLQLFMAVTASGSAEQIAVSSLIAYDVYKTYINPAATDKQVIFVSRIMVVVYGILSGLFAIILLSIGLSLGWVYLVMGIMIGSAVFPIAASITWSKCSAVAAITSALVSQPLAIMTWLVTAYTLYGEVNLTTTGENFPMMAGNLVALVFSALLCTILTYIYPQDFQWSDLKTLPGSRGCANFELKEEDRVMLDKVITWAYRAGGIFTLVFLVLWPLLSLPVGIFPKPYFTFWVVISMIWGLIAAAIIIFLPLIEASDAILANLKMIFCCQGWNNETEAAVPSPEELQAASFDDLDSEKKQDQGKVMVATGPDPTKMDRNPVAGNQGGERVNDTAHGPSPTGYNTKP